MDFIKLNKDFLNTRYPRNGIELSQSDITLYSLYRKLFTDFIIKKIKLKEYDEQIANSGLNFKINIEENMDLYQYFSKEDLDYFYIRNNIYIERLDKQEREFLIKRIKNNNYDSDKYTDEMISKSYRKMIFEDVKKDGSNCITFYGPISDSFCARNDALVIGMRYDEFNDNGLDDNSWDRLHDKQLIYIYDIFAQILKNEKDKLNVPISILKYDDFSVKALLNAENSLDEG